RSAVYDDLDPTPRSDIHLEAARLLHDQHAASDAVAAHLLDVHAAADPWVVDRLTAAASDAWASGLSATAARYLERAVHEPPPADRRGRVRLRYGQALALGQVAAAVPELLAAHHQADDDALRTEAAVALAKTYGYAHRLGDSVRLLDRAIGACSDEDLRRRTLAEQLLWAAWWADDPLRDDRMRLLDRIAPPLTGDGFVERLLITLHAWSLVLRGSPRAEALAVSDRVLRRGVVFADPDNGMEVATITTFTHLYSGGAVLAHGLFDQAIEEFERGGWRGAHLAFAYANRGHAALLRGRLPDAVADADIALRLARRSGAGTPAEWFATGTLVEALVAGGDLARAAAVSTGAYREHTPDAVILPVPQVALGTLFLAQGHHNQAAATLRGAPPLGNPAVSPWRFALALALRHSAPREARDLAATAFDEADRFGDPTTLGRAHRVLATLHASTDHLTESARLLRDSPNRRQYLQTLADLGRAQARAGHTADARRTLTEALALADDCGATGLRDTVARHLTATGATPMPPRAVNTLSPRLRRVAHLTAEGMSETDIAHKMVLSLDTVQTLVQEAHTRLATTSRTELRHALAR
ncbi:MAG: hypothetical protein HOY78_43270, partial [Saccharothrix sp.]|nr:hypothetical protein [Saccharothrix sp.]